jgi:hypothetical protein
VDKQLNKEIAEQADDIRKWGCKCIQGYYHFLWSKSIEKSPALSRGHPTRGCPPGWGLGGGATTLHRKILARYYPHTSHCCKQFTFASNVRICSGVHPSAHPIGTEPPSLGLCGTIVRLGHSSSSNSEAKSEWRFTSTCPSRLRCSVPRHEGKSTFTFV